MANNRLQYWDALKALPKAAQKTTKDTVAYEAVKRIGAIYHLDNQLSDLEPDDRKKQRQITIKPLVEAFFAWVKEVQSSNRLLKGKTLEGINYADCRAKRTPVPYSADSLRHN